MKLEHSLDFFARHSFNLMEGSEETIYHNWNEIYCRPEDKDRLAELNDSDVEYIAGKIGDALQETYWLAMGIVLPDYQEASG